MTPLRAIWFTTIWSIVPGLLDLASPIAVNAIFSLTAMALDLSYIIPIFLWVVLFVALVSVLTCKFTEMFWLVIVVVCIAIIRKSTLLLDRFIWAMGSLGGLRILLVSFGPCLLW